LGVSVYVVAMRPFLGFNDRHGNFIYRLNVNKLTNESGEDMESQNNRVIS
jgi:hypothetical protein